MFFYEVNAIEKKYAVLFQKILCIILWTISTSSPPRTLGRGCLSTCEVPQLFGNAVRWGGGVFFARRVSPQYTFHAQGRKTWTFLPLDFNNLSKPCAVPIKLVLTFEVYSKNVWGDRYAVTGELTVVCPWEANHEQWKTNKQLKNLWLKRSE